MRALLEQFIDAWAQGDVDTLMGLMTDDCVFHSSVGPEPGTTFVGATAVRAAFARFLDPANPPAGVTEQMEITAADGFGVVRWTTRGTASDGRTVITRAVDVFEFDGDRISSKDTYRKVLGDAP
ncbi:MAG: nuclear transport factor 2 family protein [Actinobacteria bacterium]|nr:nuclear transport factor 2 family protein [Actinomycetota bacterium]